MNNFSEFKKKSGYSGKELEEVTGYSRQGLHYGFATISAGRIPSKQFLVCINAAIEKRMQQEIKDHEEKMKKLRNLQNEFLEMEG